MIYGDPPIHRLSGSYSKESVGSDCVNKIPVYVEVKVSGRPLELSVPCGARHDCICPSCAAVWRKKNRKRFYAMVKDFKEIKFLTLTLKKDHGTADNVSSLWAYRKDLFRKLREGQKKVENGAVVKDAKGRPVWVRKPYRIRNWVAAVEFPNHMHILMDSEFIPQREISDLWRSITSDSYIVDIRDRGRSTTNVRKAVAYLTKYLTKLGSVDLRTSLDAKRFHLVGSFSAFYIVPFRGFSLYRRLDRWEFIAKWSEWYYPDEKEPPDQGFWF